LYGGGNITKDDSEQSFNDDYKKLLNKKNPIDKLILDLGVKGELEIGFVEVEQGYDRLQEPYNRKSIPHKGKHTS
jgi:hypothetical protein